MNTKDVHYFVNMILNATNAQVLLVSLIIFVFLFLPSSVLLVNSIDYLDQHSSWKLIIISVLSILYVLAVIILKCGSIREKKFSTARDLVQAHLKEKLKRMGFDRVREMIDESYTDHFLEKLIKKYPKVFRRWLIKSNRKPGITLRRYESQDTPTEKLQSVKTKHKDLSEPDILALLRGYFSRGATRIRSSEAIRYSDVDDKLDLPPGSTKKYIKQVVVKRGYHPVDEGEEYITFTKNIIV